MDLVVIAFERLRAVPRRGVLDPNCLVVRRQRNLFCIKRERNRIDLVVMALKRLYACIPIIFYGWFCDNPLRLLFLKAISCYIIGQAEYKC